MVDLSTLSVFLLAVLALFLSPGPNMAFVLSHGVAHGPRGGCAAALGIAAADLVLTLLTATGVTALVAAWPPSFEVLRYIGAFYLVWLGVQAIRTPARAAITRQDRAAMSKIFGTAMLNSLLNPKALLFFMVFLPQFLVPSHGNVAMQLTVLGGTLACAGFLFNCALGTFCGQAAAFLTRHKRVARSQGWLLGMLFFALAARLLLLERPLPR